MTRPYVLEPLLLGWLRGLRRSVLIDDGGNETVDVPCLGWVAHRDGSAVVFDCGPGDADPVHSPPLAPATVPDLATAVTARGVDVASVHLGVLSHLHWDHVGGVTAFPNARFLVQHTELRAALDPPPGQERTYDRAPGLRPPLWSLWQDRIEVVNGDTEVGDLAIFHLPGHTPGSQGLLVTTGAGRVLLAGDAIPLFANIRGEQPVPGGLSADRLAAMASMQRALAIADHIAPGHDAECLTESWLG